MSTLVPFDPFNIVNEGSSSAASFIRSPALLVKSPLKGNGQFKKQILDVTDTGGSQLFPDIALFVFICLVPIYDARNHQFDYANDLEHIDSVLPRFDAEIPAGSFAVVGYTMSTYKRAVNTHLNTNVQFVILLKDYE
jgi:hypothetical protein